MPDAPAPGILVDAHHHLWDLARHRQPWLEAPGHEVLRRDFTTGDLAEAATRTINGRPLACTVLVQAIASVCETRDLLAAAEADPLIGAVVGWADLTRADIDDQLDALLAAPGGRYLKALRHLVQDEADPAWLQRPEVERSLRALAKRGLSYDVLIRSDQLPQAIRLAERNPGLPLVLDHAAKPPIAAGDLDDWARQIRLLAARPQVVCKLSGLVTEADRRRWRTADIQPAWNVLIEAFGPGRLMFGSDWPVCNLAGGWDRWAAAVEHLLAECTPAEAEAVLATTASAFYRLELPQSPSESSNACS